MHTCTLKISAVKTVDGLNILGEVTIHYRPGDSSGHSDWHAFVNHPLHGETVLSARIVNSIEPVGDEQFVRVGRNGWVPLVDYEMEQAIGKLQEADPS